MTPPIKTQLDKTLFQARYGVFLLPLKTEFKSPDNFMKMDLGSMILGCGVWDLFDVSWAPEEGGLNSYLERVLERCAMSFNATSASLFLKDRHTGQFILTAKTGENVTVPDGATLTRGQGIAGISIETGMPLLLDNPSDNPLLAGKVEPGKPAIVSSIVMPLITPQQECMGVINLSRSNAQKPFQKEDLHGVGSIARHVSLAVGNARLVSQLNDALQQAQAQEERLQGVIQSLGVAVFVLDHNGQLKQWNPSAGQLTHKRLRHGSSWKSVTKAFPNVLANVLNECAGSYQQHRKRAFDPESGRSWWLTVTPIAEGGQVFMVEDVTEHEQTLNELARTRRLAEIGQMTAAIAHEIRNPLTGILGAAQMIAMEPSDALELSKVIEEEVMKLNGLCEEFLEFSRPLALRRSTFSLSKLAFSLASKMKHDFELAGIELIFRADSTDNEIDGDAIRLEQALRNLLLNALQASQPGKTVELTVRENSFWVEDQGCGMSEQTLGALFTPFYTTKAKGTGLGMSTVRKIIDAHGGTIDVQSEEGKGTRFEVRFGLRRCA